MLAVGSKCPTRPDAHGKQMTAQGWRGVEIISEEDAVAARPPCDELSDGVMDHALSYLIPSLPPVDVEGEEVSVAGNGVHLVASGYRFTLDDCLPGRSTFESHHGLIQGENLGWGDVVREGGEAVIVQRFDLLNNIPLNTYRGGLCNVEITEELLETVAKEGVDNVLGTAASTPPPNTCVGRVTRLSP
jgi:hypothetical protein